MEKKCVYYIDKNTCRIDGKPPTCEDCGCFTIQERKKKKSTF